MAKMFYTVSEAAKRLGRSAEQVRAMIGSGELQEFRSGDELVVKREQVDLLAGDEASDTGMPSEILGSSSSSLSLGDDAEDGVIGLSDSVIEDDAPIIDTGPDDSLVIGLEDSAVGGSIGGSIGGSVGGSMGLTESVTDSISLDGDTTAGSSSEPARGGDGSGIISLASQSGSHVALELDTPNAKEQTGISIFDDGLDEGDAAAATIVTDATVPEMSAYDAGGSGSGLLDLTREGDDTSLGVDLLDAGGSGAAMASVGALAEDGALFETTESGNTDLASAAPMGLMAEVYDGGGSGLVGGLAFGVVLAMLFTGGLSVVWLLGGDAALLFDQIGSVPWFVPAAGIAGVTFVVTIIAWVLGRRG